ncbi:MAG: hydroxysqualene dehydroxylase HpnE [Alicyclobacillus sp.]|nr:hydroxysqualene dehydroxylase HpnE [Alicyclobacillus sp.]
MASESGVNERRMMVIGAGWAGLAAAQHLVLHASGPTAVTVVEGRPRAGGRAFSFAGPTALEALDNGQHILLGCCDRVMQFLTAIGMGQVVRFQPRLRVPVFCSGRWSTIASRALPGVLHLLPTLTGYQHLSRAERLGMVRMVRALQVDPAPLDDVSFRDWLRRYGQSDAAIRRLWDLVGVSVLNTRAEEASAGQAVRAFQMGVVRSWRAGRLGFFQVPLGDVGTRAAEWLQRRGVDVRLNTSVREVVVRDGRVAGVRLRDGRMVPADTVIAAVPPDALLRILPEAVRQDRYFGDLRQLKWSPILNVYLRFDRPVLREDLAAFAEGTSQFVFNRGRLLGLKDADGSLLSVSISAADLIRSLDADEVARRVVSEIRAAFPAARDASLVASRTIWQPQATLLQSAGTARLRRSCRTPLPGLWLAGDWTDTGWPACLEGAVRSGEAAAREAVGTVA